MRAIEVVEGRNRQRNAVRNGVQPGEVHEIIALVLYVVSGFAGSIGAW